MSRAAFSRIVIFQFILLRRASSLVNMIHTSHLLRKSGHVFLGIQRHFHPSLSHRHRIQRSISATPKKFDEEQNGGDIANSSNISPISSKSTRPSEIYNEIFLENMEPSSEHSTTPTDPSFNDSDSNFDGNDAKKKNPDENYFLTKDSMAINAVVIQKPKLQSIPRTYTEETDFNDFGPPMDYSPYDTYLNENDYAGNEELPGVTEKEQSIQDNRRYSEIMSLGSQLPIPKSDSENKESIENNTYLNENDYAGNEELPGVTEKEQSIQENRRYSEIMSLGSQLPIPKSDSENKENIENSSSSLGKSESVEAASLVQSSSKHVAFITDIPSLILERDRLESDIFEINGNQQFNINSPRQVSKVLFGVETESTNKDTLEAMASSHRGTKTKMAGFILQFRKVIRNINKLEKQQKAKNDGTHVYNVFENEKKSDGQVHDPIYHSLSKKNNSSKGNPKKISPLLLVDASAYIFRAYYSMPPIHRSDGMPTGATLGFCSMINRIILDPLLRKERPKLILVFDSKDGNNFRKSLYPDYKANRKPCPEDLVPQFAFIKEAAKAYGIIQFEASGYEADDVIATLTTKAKDQGCDISILTGDKDLMQLITNNEEEIPNEIGEEVTRRSHTVNMIDPMKMVVFDHDGVLKKWGVAPEQLIDLLSLAGDSADNIPGVPGIGPKTAATLIQQFGSLEEIIKNADDIKQKGRRESIKKNTHLARLSRKLVELQNHIPNEKMISSTNIEDVNDFYVEDLNINRLLDFYEKMGFHDMKRKVQDKYNKQVMAGEQQSNQKGSMYENIMKSKAQVSSSVPKTDNDGDAYSSNIIARTQATVSTESKEDDEIGSTQYPNDSDKKIPMSKINKALPEIGRYDDVPF